MKYRHKIKAVIFDIGGVTIKWEDEIVYSNVAKNLAISKQKITRAAEKYMPFFDTGKITEKVFWQRVSKAVKSKTAINGIWLGHFQKYVKRNAGVIKTIKQLQKNGYTVAALTNVIRPHYLYNKKHGLYKLFDKIFASCIINKRKPQGSMYRFAAKKLKVKPEQCIFIDDRIENVIGARKVGMNAFIFKNAAQMRRDLKKKGIRL